MSIEKQIPKREPNKKNVKVVEELKNLIQTKKTILIASIKNLPASQFQQISKKLRSKAIIKVPKKSLMLRALDSSSKEIIKKLKEKIDKDIVILFSNLGAFQLAGELAVNKTPAKAKAGQEAPEDIEIQEGPTDLVPGPAISEFGALGIQIKIEKGKINISESKVIVKKNEKISKGAADIMSKLDIKPFSIGFIPLCAFDTKEEKFYAEVKIDKEGSIGKLKAAYEKALPFAVEIGYSNKDTIKFLIRKANAHGKTLENLKTSKETEESHLQNPEEKKESKEKEIQAPKENKQKGEENK